MAHRQSLAYRQTETTNRAMREGRSLLTSHGLLRTHLRGALRVASLPSRAAAVLRRYLNHRVATFAPGRISSLLCGGWPEMAVPHSRISSLLRSFCAPLQTRRRVASR